MRIKEEKGNPTGTHKDRSFQYWVSYLAAQGAKEAAVSSSGNSARSASFYCEQAGMKLTIFTKQDSKTPKRDAVRFAQERGIPLLRASTDPLAQEGYKTLAFELAEQAPDASALFVPVSSGAALLGILKGYENLGVNPPKLFCVQTAKVHPMAEAFDRNFTPEETHPARAIVDRVAHLRNQVVHACRKTGGGGYVISSQETEENLVEGHGPESAVALAAAKKWGEEGAVCLFTN